METGAFAGGEKEQVEKRDGMAACPYKLYG